MKMRSKIAALGMAALGTAGGGALALASPAEASAPGTISACTVAGGATLGVFMQPGGQIDLYGDGYCAGEGTVYYSSSEPQWFYTAPGWCVNWRINSGQISTVVAPRSGTGLYQTIYPGSGFSGNWRAYMYAYTGAAAGCPA